MHFRVTITFAATLSVFLLMTASSLLAADKVVLQLRWDHQFQFAGYYAALWRGYYRDAGLDVDIRSVFEPDGKFHNVIDEVAEGRADFGTGAIDILQARSDGTPLVVVASILQQSPVAFFAKAGTNLNSPADLTQLTVATRGPGGMATAELRAMLRAENIDPALVSLQTIREKLGLFDLLKGNADVVSGYTISAGWVAKELGLVLQNLRPATYGVDFYGSALFAHQRLVDANPELVQRFKSASLKGWEYAVENPDEIVTGITEILKRKIPIRDTRGYNTFQAAEIRKLTNYPVVQLGHTNPGRWRKMHEALVDLGLAKGELQSVNFIFDLDTLNRRSYERNVTIIIVILGGAFVGVIFVLAWWRYHSVLRLNRALSDSEKQFRGMFENAGVGVAKTSLDGRFLLANERFADIVGYDQDALLSSTFGEITHPEDVDDNLAAKRELLTGRRKNYVTEKRYVRADGGTVWTNLTVEVVRDDSGTPEYLLSVIEDIGARKQAQDNLEAARKEAEKANLSKSEFLAAMSHDLRTPLNAIIGFSDIISQQYFGSVGDKNQEYANDIKSSGELLLSLVNDILDLSAIESGEQSLTKENLSITDIAAECMTFIKERAKSLGIVLVTEVPNDLPLLYADKRGIMQILINLLSNSVKFTPEGGKITLRATATNEHHTIEIIDTGAGIPGDRIATIAEPFTKGESDPHLTQEGTGLGLAIVKSLIGLHDGELDINSTVGKGTTVTVTVPNSA